MIDSLSHGAPIAVYARVSGEEQKAGQTIDAQIEEVKRFATEQGWTIVAEYIDDGWTGGALVRPALDRLRDEARHGAFRAVLVNDVDRLARDVTDLGIVKRELERIGVHVLFRRLPGANSPVQNLLVNVLGSFAEFERAAILDRTRRGRRYKVEVRKEFMGCIAPYGYRYERKNGPLGGRLSVNKAEAEVVRDIFSLSGIDGLNTSQIVRRLNELGVKPRRGRAWQISTVAKILRNQTYVCVWHYSKHQALPPSRPRVQRPYWMSRKTSHRVRPRSEWTAISLPEELRLIPSGLFDKVQAQVSSNASLSRRRAKIFYLLRGLVRCGGCGKAYVGCHNRQKRRIQTFFRCGQRCGAFPGISEGRLNATVWIAVCRMLRDPGLIAKHLVRAVNNSPSDERQIVGEHLRQNSIDREEERAISEFRLRRIGAMELSRRLSDIEDRRAAVAQSTATSTHCSADAMKAVSEYCSVISAALDTLTPLQKQYLLRQIVSAVVFRGTDVIIRCHIDAPDNMNSIPPLTPITFDDPVNRLRLLPQPLRVVETKDAHLLPQHLKVVEAKVQATHSSSSRSSLVFSIAAAMPSTTPGRRNAA